MASGRQRFSIISDGLPSQLPDIDPDETKEWIDSFDDVVRTRGRDRMRAGGMLTQNWSGQLLISGGGDQPLPAPAGGYQPPPSRKAG